MSIRSSSSTVTFAGPFVLSGYPDSLPAGEYKVIIEEEHLQGVSFEAFRRTATYLMVGVRTGVMEMRLITEHDLKLALNRDRPANQITDKSDAALFPLEDKK